jgi:hypothetical protein
VAARARALTLAAVGIALAGATAAHVRLYNPSNGAKLFWSAPSNLTVVIDPAGSDNIPDGSHTTALQNGLDFWNTMTGTTAQLVETTWPVTNPCADWLDTTVHLIWFDETNCSGYFPGGSSTVALTPVLFQSNGLIVDGDILFNGSGFNFTTSGVAGRFDVQDVGTHELGHLLGLDHSGWGGATMYPYVDQNLILQRSISLDDEHGMREAYPSAVHGSITGTVRRLSDNSVVSGAPVWARDPNGCTAGATIANDLGVFTVSGLDADTYTVCTEPLDAPVSAGNIQGGRVVHTDFEDTIGNAVVVGAGQAVAYGDLLVDADVAISLGGAPDLLPVDGVIGGARAHSLSGSGLVAGSTLVASDPSITITGVSWFGTFVNFTVNVPGGAVPAHVDLIATNPDGDVSVLPAAIEIVPPDPTVANVTPSVGRSGSALTITGTGFRPGARVVIGSGIYVDGQVNGCTVVDANTITLTTLPTAGGTYDVVVMDPTGVEGRLVSGFCFAIPVITTSFPPTGAAGGGTEVVLTGENFLAGMTVRIDGVLQSTVVIDSYNRVTVITDPGVVGGPYVLEVRNVGGETATSAFSYALQDDPVVMDVTPAVGSAAGGRDVTISGSGFTADAVVEFGADPDTGTGGTPGTGLVFVDANTLQVTTPAHPAGLAGVMVREATTGQAHVLAAAFTFRSSGGGSCHAVPIQGPPDGRALQSLAGLLSLVLVVWGYSAHQRRRAAQRVTA